jgi:uncharacterized BrkB/YihY/UPF0761 family membrane protein
MPAFQPRTINNINRLTIQEKQKYAEICFYFLLLIGLLLSIIGNIAQKKVDANSSSAKSWVSTSAAGYIISAAAILFLMIFFILFNTSKIPTNDTLGEKITGGIGRILIYPLPCLITIGILIFAAVQTLKFQDRLAEQHVASIYYTWINTFTFLLFLQISILWFYSYNDKSPNSYKRYIIYAIGITNFAILGITQVILQYFSTDG